MPTDREKLRTLTKIEGCGTVMELLELSAADCVCPAICMNDGCDYTAEMEPDQDRGWCEECGTNSMKSALILGGII